MSLVRCTCCRDRTGALVVIDPECPALDVHRQRGEA